MKTYGSIKYSTVDAPQPIAGICESFTYKSADQIFEIMGEADLEGLVFHGRKGDISFSSTPAGSVTALGVRAGAELTITGVTGGKVLVMTSSAKWSRGQAMVMDAQANHYPDIPTLEVAVGSITPATLDLAQGSLIPLILPTGKVWFGTAGLASPTAGGIVQSCSVSESVQSQDEEDGEGKIVAVALYGYKATASMEILTADAIPDIGSELEAFGTFRITSAEEKWSKGAMRSISVEGLLIPGIV
ncbi:MAG: hypothetical protein WCS65_12610 [Verrucomicrobiae bacterium]